MKVNQKRKEKKKKIIPSPRIKTFFSETPFVNLQKLSGSGSAKE